MRWGHTSGTELLSTFLDSRHVHEILVSVFVFCLYQMMLFQRWTIVPASYAHLKAFYYLWLRSLSPFLLSSSLFLSSLSVSSSYYPEPLSCNLIWRQVPYWSNIVWNALLLKGMEQAPRKDSDTDRNGWSERMCRFFVSDSQKLECHCVDLELAPPECESINLLFKPLDLLCFTMTGLSKVIYSLVMDVNNWIFIY